MHARRRRYISGRDENLASPPPRQSSWKHPELADHDRPLNKRGKRTAPLIGALLQDEDLIADLILCSSAVRAYTTALLVAKACAYAGEIKRTRKLYLAEPQTYIEVLR